MTASGLDFGEVETFLDRHPELFEDYLMRKGKQEMVEKWLQRNSQGQGALGPGAAPARTSSLAHGTRRDGGSVGGGTGPNGSANSQPAPGGGDCGGVPLSPSWASGGRGDGSLQRKASQKELRKSFARSKAIHVNRTYDEQVTSRAQEPLSSVRRRALLRKASSLPPTTAHILSALLESRVNLPQYPTTAIDYKCHLKKHNERQFFLELVKDISNDLDLTSLSYKILIFVCLMVDADRCSLFLVEGAAAGKKSLVSKFFDVHAGTPLLPSSSTENSNEVQVPWGKGIIGYVGEHGETVNIPDAYQDRRFNDEIDKLTGYKTKSLLCMPIRSSDGEIIGVAQAINKIPEGAPFTEDDEKTGITKSKCKKSFIALIPYYQIGFENIEPTYNGSSIRFFSLGHLSSAHNLELGHPAALLRADVFNHPVELGCSQPSLAARGLAVFHELVTGDAALPTGVEDGAQMMLTSLCRSWSFLISNRLTLSQIAERIS
ncbi:dual 3',5'-cyclic-AMP and -GMP phosphodiesterase 11A-like [Microcebus murinus]|uniref:dual 3',5'-cyclic-AMP and -GMP phosphodiesterase 11A-like n=1 Tax=Microcebus murinus TaxID=30608 RepID=UPI003F6CC3D1